MKTVFIFGFLIVAAVTMSASAARANDSMARVGAGGIRLIKSEHIRMLEEVLEISTKTVSVTYRFLNESAHDIRTTVAFLMPPYHWTDGQFVVGREPEAGLDLQSLRRWSACVDQDSNEGSGRGCGRDAKASPGRTHRRKYPDLCRLPWRRGEEGIVKIVSELTPNQKEMVKQLNGGKEPWPGQIGGLLLRCETVRGIRRREAKLRLPVTFCLKILPLP